VQHEIEKAPKHRFLFLTKNPADAYRRFRHQENIWQGVSATNYDELAKRTWMIGDSNANYFLSLEPLMGEISGVYLERYNWVIVGAMTGPKAKEYPVKRVWVEKIVDECKRRGVPVFLKPNLGEAWPGELIQEYPEGLKLKTDKPHQAQI
jgi:protein gp37